MIKKISYILISVAILVAGIIAFNKLNYLDRSIWIFKTSNSDQAYEGREGRGRREFHSRIEPGNRMEFERQEGRGGRFDREGMRQMSDSLRRQFSSNNPEQAGGPQFERRMRDEERHGRGEFSGGKKVFLRNVLWFTAAFAMITMIILYLDRAFCFVSNLKNAN